MTLANTTARRARPGTYNVGDAEPLRRREYFDSLAAALGVPQPNFPPPWGASLLKSLGKLLSRSQRISSLKLRQECGWEPKYPCVREGWPATVAEMRESGPA